MAAREYTEEEERLYKLPPLPDIPFIGAEESQRRRAAYEASRKAHHEANPAAGVGSETRTTKP